MCCLQMTDRDPCFLMRSKNTGVCEAAAVDSEICLSSRSCKGGVHRRDGDEGVDMRDGDEGDDRRDGDEGVQQ